MHFITLITSLFAATLAASQTTSFDKTQLSSASSEALETDATLIYNFIIDFNLRYNEYLDFMSKNGMRLPTSIGNYFVGIQTISEESVLLEYVKTKQFPFNDFATMVTKFDWYPSILSAADMTSFYVPEDFLTGEIKQTEAVEESSASSSSGSVVSTSVLSTSSSSSASVSSSSSSSSSTSSSAAVSSSTSVSASASSLLETNFSQNDSKGQFIPLFSVLLAFLMLL